MPDPIDKLSNFEPGVPVSPMPPSEVRRRGDRLRRRNTALVIAGAVAAVILVVVPVAVFAGGDDKDTVQPVGTPITTGDLLTADELPVRDRLTPWQEADADGKVLSCAPDGASLGETDGLRQDFTADIAGTAAGDLPSAFAREQVLQFAGPADARTAYDEARGWLADCPGLAGAHRLSAQGAVELKDGGRGEWRTRSYSAPQYCGDGCDAALFDRMGIAQIDDRVVLVSLAEVGGPLEPEGLSASMEELFEAAITKVGGVVTVVSGGDASDPEPATDGLDFPISLGLAKPDADTTVDGPGPDTEGIILPKGYCGAEQWPPAEGVARLAVKVTGPEYGLWRELVTFPSEGQAAAVVAKLAASVDACPTVAGDVSANDLTFVSHDVDSGHEDATFSSTYRKGLGGVVYQFVVVGHAVLATAEYGEWSPETAADGARRLNGDNQELTALMCEYTETGC